MADRGTWGPQYVFCVIDDARFLAQWEVPNFFGPTQSALMCNFHAETFESVALRQACSPEPVTLPSTGDARRSGSPAPGNSGSAHG